MTQVSVLYNKPEQGEDGINLSVALPNVSNSRN